MEKLGCPSHGRQVAWVSPACLHPRCQAQLRNQRGQGGGGREQLQFVGQAEEGRRIRDHGSHAKAK